MYNAIIKLRPDWRLTKLVRGGVRQVPGPGCYRAGTVSVRDDRLPVFTMDSRVESMSFYERVGF